MRCAVLATVLFCSSAAIAAEGPRIGLKDRNEIDEPVCLHEGRDMACGEILAFIQPMLPDTEKSRVGKAIKSTVLNSGGQVVSAYYNLGTMRLRFGTDANVDMLISELQTRFPKARFYPHYININATPAR